MMKNAFDETKVISESVLPREESGAGHSATFSVALPLTVVHAESGPSVTRRHPSTATVPVMPNICDEIVGMKMR
jgi:hypothetical protein